MRKYFYLCSNESRFYNAVTESPEKFRYRVKSGFVFFCVDLRYVLRRKPFFRFYGKFLFLFCFRKSDPYRFFGEVRYRFMALGSKDSVHEKQNVQKGFRCKALIFKDEGAY